MFEIDVLEFQVFECGEPRTGRYLHNVYARQYGDYASVRLWDHVDPAWEWTIDLTEFTPLDNSIEPGWVSVRAMVRGADGTPYGFPRPQLIYCRPWIHPSMMVWPDSHRGPLVVTVRHPGRLTMPTIVGA